MSSKQAIGVVGLTMGFAFAGSALGSIRITEWMYNGAGGTAREFVEITNTGGAAIDLTGWSFDDNSRTPGSFAIGGLGILGAGQSAIICEPTEAAFRSAWGLSAAIKIIGGNTNNLGRADEVNIYDASNTLVDRLTYDDQTIGGPRTQGVSGNIRLANLGANAANLAVVSSVGDAYGSFASSLGDIGNPGTYSDIPAPGVLMLAAAGGAVAARRRRD
ncbi:MAG: lamin tail domain-containing protein [Planctomycetes bacterium]|nr:lamin tail domain-containing protein [Planctomycetota bacterium]